MNSNFYDNVAVAKLRQDSGLSQEDLGEILGKDRVTISRVESGRNASIELLQEYTAYFDRDYREFLRPTPQSLKDKYAPACSI
jgi:transcriptional regulator with XRE-family HTH domain